MSRYRVVRIVDDKNEYSDCICDEDKEHGMRHVMIDMLVDGAFPEGTTSKSLVGRTIECGYIHPCHWIAMAPRIVEAL